MEDLLLIYYKNSIKYIRVSVYSKAGKYLIVVRILIIYVYFYEVRDEHER